MNTMTATKAFTNSRGEIVSYTETTYFQAETGRAATAADIARAVSALDSIKLDLAPKGRKAVR